MGIFTDTFERSDRSLDAPWVVVSGTLGIVSGKVRNTGVSLALAGPISAPGPASSEVECTSDGTYQVQAYPVVKSSDDGLNRYELRFAYSGGQDTFDIYRISSGSGTRILRVTKTGTLTSPFKIKLVYTSGYLAGFINGVFVAGVTDNTHDAEVHCGFVCPIGSTETTWYEGAGDETVTLTATPYEVGTESEPTLLTLVGTYTDWTSGTPGSPTFTTSHGYLSDQAITSATTATVVFTPPSSPATVTIYDPQNGVYDTIDVVEGLPAEEPDTTCLLSAEAAAMLDDTADYYGSARLMTEDSTIDMVPPVTIPYALKLIYIYMRAVVGGVDLPEGTEGMVPDIYERLWAGEEWRGVSFAAPGTNSLKADTAAILTMLETLITPTEYTLENVIASIKGLDNRSLTQVYDLVDAIQGGDNSDVLLWLDTYLGTTGPTLVQLGTMISDLATIAGYTLGDVLTAIAAIPTNPVTSLQPVIDRLDEIQPHTINTISSITTQLNNLTDDVAAAKAQLDTIQGLIEGLPTEMPTSGPPVWPGVADATLGTPVALTAQLALDGPMHGVLVTVTVPPTHSGRISLGGEIFDYQSGQIAFVSDNGFIEPWQYIGWRQGLYTPKSMSQASAALFRVMSGCEGTARTFLRS